MEAPEESSEARRARLRAMRDAAGADAPSAPSRPAAVALSNPLAEEDAARAGGEAAGARAPQGSSFYRHVSWRSCAAAAWRARLRQLARLRACRAARADAH